VNFYSLVIFGNYLNLAEVIAYISFPSSSPPQIYDLAIFI